MKKLMDRIGSLLHLDRRGRVAGVTVFLSLLLVAAFLLVNVLASLVPSSVRQRDISAAGMYTLSDETRRVCEDLDRDVYLWLLSAGEDGSVMQTFVERYAALSPHIRAGVVDTTKNADFAAQYGASNASNYSIVVECGDRYRVLDYATLYYTVSETYDEYFLGEALLTNAIALCAADALPLVLTLTGHGEMALSDVFVDALSDNGIDCENLLLTVADGSVGSVPANCATLLIAGPTADLSEDEITAVKAYLDRGGKMLVTTDPDAVPLLPRLTALLGEYGMNAPTDGAYMIYEGNADYLIMTQAPYLMIAPLLSHAALAGSSLSYIINYAAHPIYLEDGDARVSPLVISSENACVVAPDADGNLLASDPGVLCSGAVSEDAVTGAAVIWLGSTNNYSEMIYSNFGTTNYSFLLSLLNWSTGADENVVTVMPVETNHYLTVTLIPFLILGAIIVILVPLALIVTGIVITKKRKKK